jgi:hypothetical protein
MPTFGAVECYALPYRKNASQTEVGVISYELEFAVGNANRAPVVAPFTVETVFALGDAARLAIQGAFEDSWISPIDIANKRVAQFDVLSSVDSVIAGFKNISSDLGINEIINAANKLRNTIGGAVRSGASLAAGLMVGTPDVPGLYQAVSLAQSAGDGYRAAIGLINWGSDLTLQLGEITRSSVLNDPFSDVSGSRSIPLWPGSTRGRVTRNQNRVTLVDTTRLNSYVIACEQAADSSYQTADGVVSIRDEIESGFDGMITEDGADHSRIAGRQEVRFAIENVRQATLQVLREKQQNAYKLVDVEDAGSPSLPVLTHNLYAESFGSSGDFEERLNTVRKLNPTQSAVRATGPATVLQSA